MPGCTPPPIMLDAAEGRVLEIPGMQVVMKVSGTASGGSVGVVEMRVPSGQGPHMHIHRKEEETIHVLAGRFRFWCGDRVWDGGEGATVMLPRGVPHTFQNIARAPGRLLAIAPLGGFEQFFERYDALRSRLPGDKEALRALTVEFGYEITGPQPSPPERNGG